MTRSQLPEGAHTAPSQRPNLKQQLTDDISATGGAIAPDNACDEPAPEAPGGKGQGAIGIDPLSGRPYDKVYGVRPKTTWHLKPALQRNLWEFIASLDIAPDAAYQRRDEKAPLRGPPPRRPMWEENAFIVSTGIVPILLHSAWNYALPEHKMHWAPAWLLYHLCFILFAVGLIKRLHKFIAEYGCFDELNRGRDMVDDSHVNHLGRSIFIYTIFRSAGPFVMAWRGEMTNPLEGLSWITPIKIGMWHVCLDYFFYLYHRSTHEFDSLWWVHRQHHATKHPTPILSILADDVQECLEIFIVPFLATTIAPRMSFAELHLTICYTLYVEALGHSGVRAEWPHPILGLILKPL
jgi:sterol desaturase/sphingolipid hydroxylase (fatty acid hydroxylase superfamily)